MSITLELVKRRVDELRTARAEVAAASEERISALVERSLSYARNSVMAVVAAAILDCQKIAIAHCSIAYERDSSPLERNNAQRRLAGIICGELNDAAGECVASYDPVAGSFSICTDAFKK